MKVHHLNCGTLCPASARIATGEGGIFERARFVCHCLLLETSDGLVLVDTGLGSRDLADPESLGRGFLRRSRPRLSPDETAIAHVERLGFRREDVRHVIPTHLDLDHAGGLADFPDATVHVFRAEYEAGIVPTGRSVKYGYRPAQWSHGPRWLPYDVGGDRWLDFRSVRVITGLNEEIALVPLVGHTLGHCGVAVKVDDGWLLHAGDLYFTAKEMDPVAPKAPLGSALFQKLRSVDDAARRANVERVRELARRHPEVRVFSAHSAKEFARYAGVADHTS